MTNSMTNSEILNEDKMFLLQVELEKGMTQAGAVRFESRRTKNIERGTEADTAYGSTIISHCTGPLATAIEQFIADAQSGKAGKKPRAYVVVKDLDPRITAMLTLKAVLNHLSTHRTLQDVLSIIGGFIEDEIRFRTMREQDEKLYKWMLDEANKRCSYFHKRYYMKRTSARLGFEWSNWASDEKVLIGQKMLDLLMCSVPDLVELVTQTEGKNHTVKYLKATAKTLEWMDKRNASGMQTQPIYEPMVVPPRAWDTPFDGGYLTSFVKPLTMVKTRNRNYLDAIAEVEMPVVKRSLEAMQNTAWNINKPVLEVMMKLWDNGGGIAGLPLKFHKEEPIKPMDIDTNAEAKKAWKIDASHVHKENLEITSSRAGFAMTMLTAEKYAVYEKIYFPYQLDFRGRCYAVTTTISPQGPDSQKGLLRFAEGKTLGEEGGAWLAVQGSNLAGVDKVSFEDRVQFILDNEEEIKAIAADPYTNKGWISGFANRRDSKGDPAATDSPFQFLAFCFEWAQYCEEGEDFVSRIAISLDGSCSGLQHYGMALADEIGGKFVNLIPAEKPADIYAEVARKVMIQLEKDAVEGTQDGEKEHKDKDTGEITMRSFEGTATLAKQWLKFGINRTTCKRSVMTLPYGSREYGFRDQLSTDILRPALRKATRKDRSVDREAFPFEKDGFAAAGYMAKLIWVAVSATVVKATEAMDWLKGVASLVGSEGLPIKWTTPAGFPVMQAYRDMTPRKVQTQINGSRVVLTVNKEEDTIDRRAQAGAVAPNVIHSWDASQLMLTVDRCASQGLTNFALVHDSFGTTAGDLPVLYRAVRETMYEQYSQTDVFANWRDEVVAQLTEKNREKVEPLPSRGNLDLSLILESRYCFA